MKINTSSEMFRAGNWVQMHSEFITRMIGRFMLNKALDQQSMQGTHQAARNLRKQGVPLAVALLILVGRV